MKMLDELLDFAYSWWTGKTVDGDKLYAQEMYRITDISVWQSTAPGDGIICSIKGPNINNLVMSNRDLLFTTLKEATDAM